MPKVESLFEQAGVDVMVDAKTRSIILAAMKKAAEKRIAGVTEMKRRNYYGHAAKLVASCIACDRTRETMQWVTLVDAALNDIP